MGWNGLTNTVKMSIFQAASINEIEAVLIAAALAAVIAVWAVITQRIVTRRSNTLMVLREIDSDRDLIEARDKFIIVTKDAVGIEQYADLAKRDDPNTAAIRLVLNSHERIALGIQFGIIDKEFFSRHSRGTILRDWSLAAPFVYKVRTNANNPAIYHEFEELARALNDNNMPRRTTWWRLWF